MPNLLLESDATIDQTGAYRYTLTRTWDLFKPGVLWIMLNPSTADETTDDPTIRRCMTFSKAWGAGCLCVVNLFAYRATKPSELLSVTNPIGEKNDFWIKNRIETYSEIGDTIVVAWGNNASRPALNQRRLSVLRMLPVAETYCLGTTKTGDPRHPLYCPSDVTPTLYDFPAEVWE